MSEMKFISFILIIKHDLYLAWVQLFKKTYLSLLPISQVELKYPGLHPSKHDPFTW